MLKISSSEGLESTEERLSERSIGCFLNLFHGRKMYFRISRIRVYTVYQRVHSNFFHVGIAKLKCKYQKWQRIILTTNHDFLGKCQRMGGNSKSILLNSHLSFIVLLMMLGTSVCYEMLPFQMRSCYDTYSCEDLFSIHVIVFVNPGSRASLNKKRG